MKFICLSLLVLFVSCSKSKNYDKRGETKISAPEDVSVVNNNPSEIKGKIKNGLFISIHQSSNCSDTIIVEYTASEFLSGINYPNPSNVSVLYAKVRNEINQSICYPLTSGLHVDAKSFFTIEKELITPKLPIQNNLISYHARDVNNNPVSGLGPISFTVTPEDLAPFNATFVETTTLGTYSATISLGENYALDLVLGEIPVETTRHIGDVVVTDDPFCYVSGTGRLSWTNHKQSGAGTIADPYLICTAAQMKSLANATDFANDFTKSYKLMASLNMQSFLSSSANLFSIGVPADFTGNFDGNNLSITNFKLQNSARGLFFRVGGGSIKNLKLQVNDANVGLDGVAVGLMINSINTSADVVVSNVSVKAQVEMSLDASEFGGVIGTINAPGSNQVQMERMKSQITATSVLGDTYGGVVGSITSTTSGRVTMNQVESTQTISVSGSNDIIIGGVVGYATGTHMDNIKSRITTTQSSVDDISRLGGIAGYMNDSRINHSYAQGENTVNDIQGFGGLSGEITNNSRVENSFALVNITGEDCLDVCGKTIGITGSLDNTVVGLYTSNQASLSFASINDTGVSETSINLTTTPSYFFMATNPPMNTWDFTTIWVENSATLPSINSSSL